jgi:hypothetical protein
LPDNGAAALAGVIESDGASAEVAAAVAPVRTVRRSSNLIILPPIVANCIAKTRD